MRVIYAILAVSGWVWLFVLAAYMIWRERRRPQQPRGFDIVVQKHEKQP